MNNQQTINTGTPESQAPAQTLPPKVAIQELVSKILAKVPQPVKESLNKFYSNKKIFWPVTAALGLVILTAILGLAFGSRKTTPISKSTPTPEATGTPIASPSGDILSVTEQKLINLGKEIDSLDVRQAKLQPPQINYDIKF